MNMLNDFATSGALPPLKTLHSKHTGLRSKFRASGAKPGSASLWRRPAKTDGIEE